MMIINSMTDVITNSSTSVFVVYAEHNIDSIKELVNSILAIDGRYTFDDLFNISLEFNYDVIERYSEQLSEEFSEFAQDNADYEKILDSFDEEKKSRLADELWSFINYDYEYCNKSPYDYISVTVKKDSPEIEKAAELISNIDRIFDLDYHSDY
jgi:ABC-type uncharacterized transport system ATPase subunit